MLHRVKKENDINEGKWIGVGGHAENGESPEDCLLREVKEETGLTLTSYRFRALITFISDKQEPELMCLFTADEFSGKLITCNEGDLKWVDKTIVPTLPTWSVRPRWSYRRPGSRPGSKAACPPDRRSGRCCHTGTGSKPPR